MQIAFSHLLHALFSAADGSLFTMAFLIHLLSSRTAGRFLAFTQTQPMLAAGKMLKRIEKKIILAGE